MKQEDKHEAEKYGAELYNMYQFWLLPNHFS